jgi:hypothetical protein
MIRHLALDASLTRCGTTVSAGERNVNPLEATCSVCLQRWEAAQWTRVNEARASGNASELDTVRAHIARVRKHHGRRFAF